MAFYVSPGVYTRERDISNIIPNIATTIGALVGYSTKGDTDSIKLVTNSQQFIQEYGEPNPVDGYFHYSALAFLEQGNQLYCLRVHNGALFGGVKIVQDGTGANAAIDAGSTDASYEDISGESLAFYIFGKDPGAWNNNLRIRITNVDATAFTFDIEVYEVDEDGNEVQVESWTVSRKAQIDGFGRQQYLEEAINGFSKYIRVADNTALSDTVMPEEQAASLALAQGSDGNAVTSSELVSGWDEFSNPDNIDVRILINGGQTSVTVQQKMKAICESRLDCIAILDVPISEHGSITDIVDWRESTQNFNSSYTALFAGWPNIYDQYNDRVLNVPPSGYVGAQMAYNDFVADPWFAPAGFNRGRLNVLGVSNVFTQGERNTLYEAGVNPIQLFRGEGVVIWGQKTQQTKASALDRINVRRLLIVLEKSISIQLRNFVFEPNSEVTRFRIQALLEEYLTRLGARGAFQTELGDQGFRVVVDETNNTPAVIDANELHVDVFLKPSRAAEFIQLQAIVTRTGASFEELISRGELF